MITKATVMFLFIASPEIQKIIKNYTRFTETDDDRKNSIFLIATACFFLFATVTTISLLSAYVVHPKQIS